MEKLVDLGNGTKVKVVPLDKFEYLTGIKITRECSGKMKGLWALNTAMTVNPLCQKMSKNKDFICSKCYAKGLLAFRKSARKRFEKNFELLSKEELIIVPDIDEAMEMFAKQIFRFEMDGDVANETQAYNYLIISICNPKTLMGLWTKQLRIYANVLFKRHLSVPDNLSIVASSRKMNEVDNIYKKYDFVDHVFTVYRYDYAKEHDIETNCAASSCFNCMRCYRKGTKDFFINEMLKADHNKHKND